MVDSLSRSCFRKNANPNGGQNAGKQPTGARNKLPSACRSVHFQHTFDPLTKGIADAGKTQITVVPGMDYSFQITRRVSERDLGDWGAALALIDALMAQHRADFSKGLSVLELGCGLGVPGMVCACLGADVVLTDRDDENDVVHSAMKLLDENVSACFMGPAKSPPGIASGRAGVVEFCWDTEAAQELVQKFGYFDFIIASDCVYQPIYGKSWMQLAESLDVLCGPTTSIFLSFQRRTEDGVDSFLALLYELRFLVQKQRPKTAAEDIEIYTLRRVSSVETFHVDVLSSATHVAEDDVVNAYRKKTQKRCA